MITIFVLRIPEFIPIMETVQKAGLCEDYFRDYIQFCTNKKEIKLLRSHTGVRPSIWFASLTGGFYGSIIKFDHDVIWLSSDAAEMKI